MSVRHSEFEHTDVRYYSAEEGEAVGFSIEIGGRGARHEWSPWSDIREQHCVHCLVERSQMREDEKCTEGVWTLLLGDMAYHSITQQMQEGIKTEEDAREIAALLNETGYDEAAVGELIYRAVEGERERSKVG